MPQEPTPSMPTVNYPQQHFDKPKPQTQEHPEDLILVRNIDMDCDYVTSDTKSQTFSKPSVNPQTGRQDEFTTQESKEIYIEFSHDKYFEVRWDSRPFRIAPGETRIFPRYIAEHFAKYLADHMLQKEEEKTHKKGLVSSRQRRPKVLQQILVEITSYYNDPGLMTEGEQAEQRVEELNEDTSHALDVGIIPNKAVGILKDEPTAISEKIKHIDKPTSGRPKKFDDSGKLNVTKTQLLEEAEELGLEVTGKESKVQLQALITNF